LDDTHTAHPEITEVNITIANVISVCNQTHTAFVSTTFPNYLNNILKEYWIKNIIQVITLDTKTFEGRDMKLIKISKGMEDKKPVIWVDSGMFTKLEFGIQIIRIH